VQPEIRNQKSEIRRQEAEGRRQKAEGKAEGRKQKAESRQSQRIFNGCLLPFCLPTSISDFWFLVSGFCLLISDF
jgi:hypothetical protein